jgi:hypothetical protein
MTHVDVPLGLILRELGPHRPGQAAPMLSWRLKQRSTPCAMFQV